MATRKTIGLRGEQEAVRYLQKRGYKIIAHREQILRGDIDIIALYKRTVVFVEVRSKTNTEHGHPAETIDARKQRRICMLANAFIQQHRLEAYSFRLDVITVLFSNSIEVQNGWLFWRSGDSPIIEHFQNAFESDA